MICPLIGKCAEKVPFDTYNKVCSNMTKDAYLECPKYKEITSGLRTPREWQRQISP